MKSEKDTSTEDSAELKSFSWKISKTTNSLKDGTIKKGGSINYQY